MPVTAEFWPSRRIFIFGGSGFFGSWAIREFRNLQASVGCLIRNTPEHSGFLNSFYLGPLAIMRGNASDRQACLRNLAAFEPDLIIHLAAADPRLDEAILQASLRLARPVPVIVPVAVEHPSRLAMFHRLLDQFPSPLTVALFPMLFGIGDFRGQSLLRRAWRHQRRGEPFSAGSPEELAQPYLDVRDAVAGLVVLAETVLADRTWQGQVVSMLPDDWLPSGADILEQCGVQLPPSSSLRVCRADDRTNRQLPGWAPRIPWQQAVEESWAWLHQEGNSQQESPRIAVQRHAA